MTVELEELKASQLDPSAFDLPAPLCDGLFVTGTSDGLVRIAFGEKIPGDSTTTVWRSCVVLRPSEVARLSEILGQIGKRIIHPIAPSGLT